MDEPPSFPGLSMSFGKWITELRTIQSDHWVDMIGEDVWWRYWEVGTSPEDACEEEQKLRLI